MRFPPRVTADGTRISSLPVAEAERAIAAALRALGAGSSTGNHQPSGGANLTRVLSARRATRTLDADRARGAPVRRTLSEAEMARIESGGAE